MLPARSEPFGVHCLDSHSRWRSCFHHEHHAWLLVLPELLLAIHQVDPGVDVPWLPALILTFCSIKISSGWSAAASWLHVANGCHNSPELAEVSDIVPSLTSDWESSSPEWLWGARTRAATLLAHTSSSHADAAAGLSYSSTRSPLLHPKIWLPLTFDQCLCPRRHFLHIGESLSPSAGPYCFPVSYGSGSIRHSCPGPPHSSWIHSVELKAHHHLSYILPICFLHL